MLCRLQTDMIAITGRWALSTSDRIVEPLENLNILTSWSKYEGSIHPFFPFPLLYHLFSFALACVLMAGNPMDEAYFFHPNPIEYYFTVRTCGE